MSNKEKSLEQSQKPPTKQSDQLVHDDLVFFDENTNLIRKKQQLYKSLLFLVILCLIIFEKGKN